MNRKGILWFKASEGTAMPCETTRHPQHSMSKITIMSNYSITCNHNCTILTVHLTITNYLQGVSWYTCAMKYAFNTVPENQHKIFFETSLTENKTWAAWQAGHHQWHPTFSWLQYMVPPETKPPNPQYLSSVHENNLLGNDLGLILSSLIETRRHINAAVNLVNR